MSGSRSLALAFACALLSPVAAAAEPQWGLPSQRGYGTNGNQTAYNEGYDRGVRAGDVDARRGDAFQYVDESDYRRGDVGYDSRYGNRNQYRDEFRRGYVSGYRDGYQRVGINTGRGSNLPPWSNGRGYAVGRNGANNPAWNNGYTDGYEQGLKDGRDRHRDDPLAESRYRSGDRGYDSRYGPREQYRSAYREAFRTAYERGYQEAWRYNRPY